MNDPIFTPGPTPNTVLAADGTALTVPEGWILLPPGDAALTRRVKAAGEHWVVAEKKGRKVFSRGVWAPAATVERIRGELGAERATEGFTRRKAADARRREHAQAEYVEDFRGAVHPAAGYVTGGRGPRRAWGQARREPRPPVTGASRLTGTCPAPAG